ncbi:MAG: aminotransferase class III-fold pyridoxal phosphate-dependent enzyme [Burkholderiaceae bacterium]|nr:aminotransferase class III-fold pyridoxal phosphate-dependent enzyme [Burkholderiaceae bacterium]
MQNNYGEPKINLVTGKGLVVTDANGKKYLDFLSGIATNVLGHAHPAIVRAVSKQIATLGHVSNLYSHPAGLELAKKLIEMTGDPTARVFFCNSGAEANEAAIKLSRKTGRSAKAFTKDWKVSNSCNQRIFSWTNDGSAFTHGSA